MYPQRMGSGARAHRIYLVDLCASIERQVGKELETPNSKMLQIGRAAGVL